MIYLVAFHNSDGSVKEVVATHSHYKTIVRYLSINKKAWDYLSVLAIDYPATVHPSEGLVAHTDIWEPNEFVEHSESGELETIYHNSK